jgi:hypothetical protein
VRAPVRERAMAPCVAADAREIVRNAQSHGFNGGTLAEAGLLTNGRVHECGSPALGIPSPARTGTWIPDGSASAPPFTTLGRPQIMTSQEL